MKQSEALVIVEKTVGQCQLCSELATTRTKTVFGVGKPNANVMFIGEAPGRDEDLEGKPFIGKAGQLLTNIITSIGWKREDIYICNILKCRPPNNRDPKPEESKNCRKFLEKQIKIVNPKFIVCLGKIASRELLGLSEDTLMAAMRGKFFDYNGIKVLCTYHPSYLLRNPSAKKDVWQDLQLLLEEIST